MPSKKDLAGAVLTNRRQVVLSNEQIEALNKAANLEFSSTQRRSIQRILNRYDGLFAAAAQAVNVKQVIERIEDLQRAILTLRALTDTPAQESERPSADRALLARLRSFPSPLQID